MTPPASSSSACDGCAGGGARPRSRRSAGRVRGEAPRRPRRRRRPGRAAGGLAAALDPALLAGRRGPGAEPILLVLQRRQARHHARLAAARGRRATAPAGGAGRRRDRDRAARHAGRARAPCAEPAARHRLDHALRADGAVPRLARFGHGRTGDGRYDVRERPSRRHVAACARPPALPSGGHPRGRGRGERAPRPRHHRSRPGRRREPPGRRGWRARARAGPLAPDGARRLAPGHAPLDALLPRRPLPRRLGDALHARGLDVARRVDEGRRHGRRAGRPGVRGREDADGGRGAPVRSPRRVGGALHRRGAGGGRAAPPHPLRGGAPARSPAPRPAPRRARLLRADRAPGPGAHRPLPGRALSPDGRALARRAAAAPRRAQRRGPRLMRPLDGIRVLDFTWVVAGPVTTRILADLGAQVIKVERRGSLDFGDRRGGLSGALMRGKRSLLLDLNDPRGLDLARRLPAVSDVVIDHLSARVMTNLGLDYDALAQLRPDVICVRMTGFGLTGPDRDHVSYGPTLQALPGYTLPMAEPGGPPAGFGHSYSDPAGGNLGALAVLAAIWHRRRTGRGQLVDLAQLETAASVLGPVLLDRAVHGGASAPAGNASQEAPGAPHGVYPCAGEERGIAITVFTDAEWERLGEAVGRPAWTRDARFATGAGRLRHAAELDRHVTEWTRGQKAEEAMVLLQRAGVAAGLVANAEDLCARDPQLAARRHFVEVPTPEGRTVRIDGPPFVLSETPAAVSGPGPLLGEHADEVLSGLLGMGAEEIAALRAARVLG